MKSVTNSALAERVGEPPGPEFLAAQLARLNATFGEPKNRSPELARIWAREWLRALSGYGQKTIKAAFDQVILSNKFWPTISEVVGLCKADDVHHRDMVGLVNPTPHLEDYTGRGSQGFCREGRTEAEEIAYRTAQVEAIKAKHDWKPITDNGLAPPRETAPASQDMTVSESLRSSCAARRARGEPTCEPSCCRQACELKVQQQQRAA